MKRKRVVFRKKSGSFALAGQETTFTGLPAMNARIFSAAISISLERASWVPQAMWGVSIMLGAFSSGLSARMGSTLATSEAAAQSLPLLSASAKAYSSTTGPRLVLMRIAPSFIFAMVSRLIR